MAATTGVGQVVVVVGWQPRAWTLDARLAPRKRRGPASVQRISLAAALSLSRENTMPGLKRTRAQVDAADSPAYASSDRHAAMTAAKRKTDGYAPHAKKQRTGAQNHPKYQPKKFSLNPLKARIRDLRRQLSRTGDDMPANIRVDKERELQACEHELSVAEAERIKQDMIPRYHKVRFFGMRCLLRCEA